MDCAIFWKKQEELGALVKADANTSKAANNLLISNALKITATAKEYDFSPLPPPSYPFSSRKRSFKEAEVEAQASDDSRDLSSQSTNHNSDSEWRSRESTPSSDSSEEMANSEAATTSFDYLVSMNEDDLISTDGLANEWVLADGRSFSTDFLRQRNQLVKRCSGCDKLMSHEEQLALNGIVLLENELQTKMVKKDTYEQALQELYERYSNYQEQDEAYLTSVSQFAKFMSTGQIDKAEGPINDSSMPGRVKAILYSLKRTYGIGYSTKGLNESTIVKDGIQPFLDYYFANCKQYTTYGSDKEITECKKRFAAIDPSLVDHVKKADFSVVSNYSHHLIFALGSKSERSKSKSTDDLVKMARYMKDTLDSIEADGFNQVAIAGTISSGVNCSLYIMEHRHDYIRIHNVLDHLKNGLNGPH